MNYNCVREAVADGAISLTHVMSENKYTGLLTKALSGAKYYDMYKLFMFTENIERKAQREGSEIKECNFSLQG